MEMWDTQKADLRKQMRGRLKAVDAEEKAAWDREVCRRVLSRPEIAGADWVLGYMALSWETGTRELLEALLKEGKRVALPRVALSRSGGVQAMPRMDFFEIHSMEDLEEGAFHILEPGGRCPRADWRTAPVLVPGMAFTPDGMRLGKGGGYYDCFLEREPDHGTLALAYGFQMVETLPGEAHDRPVDMVITPERIFECGRLREKEWAAGKARSERWI